MAKNSAENVVKTTIIAADGTAPGAKAAKDTIQKTVGGVKPVDIKAQVAKGSLGEMRQKVGSHFGEMFSAVAIGNLISDGVKFAFRNAMEQVFKSVELWDVFESSAKRAFAGAQSQGFRGDFDTFAADQLKRINSVSMAYGVPQAQLESAVAMLSKVYSPTQVNGMVAGLAKLQLTTGKSAEEWASLMMKIKGGSFQARQLAEMGIALPKGFKGEEQGEAVTNLVNDYIKRMTNQDTSFLTQDMPLDQITAMLDAIRLNVGMALDAPITNVISGLRDSLLGAFGSLENVGKIVAVNIIDSVKITANILGVFRIIWNVITAGLRLVVGAIGLIAAPIGGLVAKLTGTGTYKGYVSGFWESWRKGFSTDMGDMKESWSMLGFDPSAPIQNRYVQAGHAQSMQNIAMVDAQARNMTGVSVDKSVFAKQTADKEAKEDAKEKKAQGKVVIQMPYGMRPAFANSYTPSNTVPMRRY